MDHRATIDTKDSIKFPRVSSHIRCLNGEYTNVLRTIFVLIIRELMPDEEKDGSRKVGSLAI